MSGAHFGTRLATEAGKTGPFLPLPPESARHPHRFTKPEQQDGNFSLEQGLAREGKADLVGNLAQIPEQYPELAKPL